MCSDTEHLEMLIVLHICSFLMLYDSGDMSFDESEAVVLYSQSR